MSIPRVQGAVVGMVSLIAMLPFAGASAQEDVEDFERLRAGELPRGQTVTERERPELEPLGLRMGGFTAFPRLEIGEVYNSNIFAQADDEEEDFITRIRPSLTLSSNWPVHALDFFAEATIDRYVDNTDEDTEDYRLGFDGELEIRRGSVLSGGAEFRQLHIPRESPEDTGAEEPTEFDRLEADTQFRQELGRLNVTLGGAVASFDFDDDRTGTGLNINNDDRDRDELEGMVRVGYELVPDYEAFVRGTYNQRDYDADIDDNGLDRDSDGYEAVAGVAIDFGGITFGELFAGYRSQEYDDAQLETVDGFTAGAAVTWNVTPLTTVVATLERDIRETTIVDAAGRFQTEVGVSVDHELLRNLLLGADASYLKDDFDGIDREDDVYRVGIGADYFLNRFFSISASYAFERRESNVDAAEYDQNIFFIRLAAQY